MTGFRNNYDVVRSGSEVDPICDRKDDMKDIGWRLATPEENERARHELVDGNARATAEARKRGLTPNARILAADLR